jgi:hypothetical protein
LGPEQEGQFVEDVSVVDWAKARQGRNARVTSRGIFMVVIMTLALLVWLQEFLYQHHDRSESWIEELGRTLSPAISFYGQSRSLLDYYFSPLKTNQKSQKNASFSQSTNLSTNAEK